MPDLILLTTSDMHGGRSDVLDRMLASVERFRERAPGITVRSYLLLQRLDPAQQAEFPSWVQVMPYVERMSLSAARNRMLARVRADGVDDDAVVAFPDDDAWYPDGTLDYVTRLFAAQPELDLWFCRYGTGAAGPGDGVEHRPGLQQTLSFASSNTTVVRGRLLKAIGGFDEELGVGTPAGGGEDTEFALRAYHAARGIAFLDSVVVGHRDGDPAIRAKYYAGSLRAITRHAGLSAEARLAWLRKLAVGVAYTAMGRLSPGGFLKAVRASR